MVEGGRGGGGGGGLTLNAMHLQMLCGNAIDANTCRALPIIVIMWDNNAIVKFWDTRARNLHVSCTSWLYGDQRNMSIQQHESQDTATHKLHQFRAHVFSRVCQPPNTYDYRSMPSGSLSTLAETSRSVKGVK